MKYIFRNKKRNQTNLYTERLFLNEYEKYTCESCWGKCKELLFDGINHVCESCYERNELIDEVHC